MEMTTTGQRLRAAMRRKAISQGRFAALLGVPQATVSKIVTGQMPGTKHLPRIAELLDVPLEWLTTGYPEQPWAVGLFDAASVTGEG